MKGRKKEKIWHDKDLNQCSMTQEIRLKLFTDYKTNSQKTLIYGESFRGFSTFAQLFQKNGFEFVEQILYFCALYQYSITSKIGFRLLTESKTSLQITPLWEEKLWKVLMSASLSQKNVSVFALYHFVTLCLVFRQPMFF